MQALPQRMHGFFVITLQVIAALLMLSLLFINVWYIGGVFPKTLQWNTVLLLALSLSQALLQMLSKEARGRSPTFIFLFSGFLIWVGVHAFYLSPVATLAKRELFLLLQAFLLAYLAYTLWESTLFQKTLIAGIIVLLLLELGVAFYQYYFNPYWLPENLKLPVYSDRSSGTFGSPNHFAGFLSLVLFPTLTALFSSHLSKPIRLFTAVLVGLLIWGLGLAFSRGAFIGIAAGLSLLPWVFYKKKPFRHSYIVGFIILGLGLSYLLFNHLPVFQRRLHFSINEGLDYTRLAFWKAALYLFLEHPLFGQGGASFNCLFEKYRPLGFFHEPIWVHNEYLNTLCDYGLVGFILLMVPLVYSLRRCWIHLRAEPSWLSTGLFVSLLAYGVHCFFDFNCRIPGLLFTAVLAYVILLRSVPEGPRLSKPYICLAPCLSLALLYSTWPVYQVDKLCKKVNDALLEAENKAESPPSPFYEGLRRDLEQGLALEPSHEELWFNLAKVYYALSRIEPESDFKAKQLEAIQKALASRQIYWFYWVHYGISLSLNGEFSKAQGALQTALNLAPYQWKAWYYYALCLKLEKARPDKALEAIQQCLRLNPKNFLAERLKVEIENEFSLHSHP